MRYHWTDCSGCGCQIVVTTTSSGGKVTGALRRWSTDRSINDGRPIRGLVLDPSGGFATECVCGKMLTLGATADAVGAERGD